jgi:phage terminase large subunit-like protein
MVENTLRAFDKNLSYSKVHASRGKFTRAEPIAALYEQGKIHHVGLHAQLEDQMTSFVPDIDRGKMGSPDRVDALVWAMTELMVQKVPFESLLEYYRAETARIKGAQAQAAQ